MSVPILLVYRRCRRPWVRVHLLCCRSTGRCWDCPMPAPTAPQQDMAGPSVGTALPGSQHKERGRNSPAGTRRKEEEGRTGSRLQSRDPPVAPGQEAVLEQGTVWRGRGNREGFSGTDTSPGPRPCMTCLGAGGGLVRNGGVKVAWEGGGCQREGPCFSPYHSEFSCQ